MPRPQSQDSGPLPHLQAPSRGASLSPNTGLDRGSGHEGGREAHQGCPSSRSGPSSASPAGPLGLLRAPHLGTEHSPGDSAATRGRAGQREGATGPLGNGHTWRGTSPQATGPPRTTHGCSRAARSFPLGWSKTWQMGAAPEGGWSLPSGWRWPHAPDWGLHG